MSHENDLQHLTVEDLAQRCAQETDYFFNHKENDPRYCFELFRRSIRERNERALSAVITQYQPLVETWVDKWMNSNQETQSISDEAQDYVAQAFERFWISFTPAKFDRSQSLAAVLRYLQMCVNGAITDAWRKSRRFRLGQEATDDEQQLSDPDPTPEDLLQAEEFWQLIRKKSKDPREYTVVYASFHLDLSPREILAEYRNEFRHIKEIYQHKANFLERLERDDEIREFLRQR
jgi:RNA polymerase sigma factor (sigma-70 family)